jgi:hypothetical protein
MIHVWYIMIYYETAPIVSLYTMYIDLGTSCACYGFPAYLNLALGLVSIVCLCLGLEPKFYTMLPCGKAVVTDSPFTPIMDSKTVQIECFECLDIKGSSWSRTIEEKCVNPRKTCVVGLRNQPLPPGAHTLTKPHVASVGFAQGWHSRLSVLETSELENTMEFPISPFTFRFINFIQLCIISQPVRKESRSLTFGYWSFSGCPCDHSLCRRTSFYTELKAHIHQPTSHLNISGK